MAKRHNVDYQNRFKKKNPARANHLEAYKWKPGQSGNPSGKTRGNPSLINSLMKYLRRHPELVDQLAEQWVKIGIQSNPSQLQAIDKIADRLDGKVAETHKLEGDLPLFIQFVPAHTILDSKKDDVIEGQSFVIKQLGNTEEEKEETI